MYLKPQSSVFTCVNGDYYSTVQCKPKGMSYISVTPRHTQWTVPWTDRVLITACPDAFIKCHKTGYCII